jgi:serine/threonine protein kinase, bacterial
MNMICSLRQFSLAAMAAMVLVLCSACGGGGGGTSPQPSPAAVTPDVGSGSNAGPSQPPPPPPPTITLVAGSIERLEFGFADGNGAAARFRGPRGLAFDTAGALYVADTGNNAIRKISTSGQVTTVAGVPGADEYGDQDGPALQARFDGPTGLAFDAAGNLYIADSYNLKIRKLTPAGMVSTFAIIPVGNNIDGRSMSAYLAVDIAVDSAGNVYATNGIGTRKIAPNGELTILQGTNTRDNMIGTAVSSRRPIVVDPDGQVFIGGRGQVGKISPEGNMTVLAGGGDAGNADGTGSAAHFNDSIAGLVLDRNGNLYAADTWNRAIRKITPAGVVTTIAGHANPEDIVYDPMGRKVLDTVLGPFPGTMTPVALALGADGALYTISGQAVIRIPLP